MSTGYDDRRTGGAFDNPHVDHEPGDVPLGGVLGFLATLLVSAVVIHVLVWGLMRALQREDAAPRLSGATPFVTRWGEPPPGPQFDDLRRAASVTPVQQVHPVAEMSALRAAQERELTRWSVDRVTGRVRIPIDVAMRLRADGTLGSVAGDRGGPTAVPALAPRPTDAGGFVDPAEAWMDRGQR